MRGVDYGTSARGARSPQARPVLKGSREEQLRRHLPLVHRVVQRLAARKPLHAGQAAAV